jgi:uncharacterized protein YerC
MAQVSKYRLRPDVWEKVFNMFLESFLSVKKKDDLNAFVHSIFTPTERIMLAKRFAAAVLLAKGTDQRSVARKLRMSTTTISKMSSILKYEGDGLYPVIEKIIRSQSKEIVIKELSDLLDIPGKGTDIGQWKKRSKKRQREIDEIKSGF